MPGPTSSNVATAITVAALPLPVGAALNTSVDGVEGKLDTIAGQLDNKTSTLAKEAGGNLDTIVNRITTGGQLMVAVQQITSEIQAMRGQTPIPFTWVANAGVEVATGAMLTLGAKYEVTCVQWESDDNGSAATTIQLSIGYATGFTPGADQHELYLSAVQTFVAGAIGVANPFTIGRPFTDDGTGNLYVVPTPDAGTTNGSGTIWVRRIY